MNILRTDRIRVFPFGISVVECLLCPCDSEYSQEGETQILSLKCDPVGHPQPSLGKAAVDPDPLIVQVVRSILIKDTTKEEREEIIRSSLDCGAGSCENCSSCWLGGGNPWEIYQDYIDGKREIREINMEYNERYLHGRQIKG